MRIRDFGEQSHLWGDVGAFAGGAGIGWGAPLRWIGTGRGLSSGFRVIFSHFWVILGHFGLGTGRIEAVSFQPSAISQILSMRGNAARGRETGRLRSRLGAAVVDDWFSDFVWWGLALVA